MHISDLTSPTIRVLKYQKYQKYFSLLYDEGFKKYNLENAEINMSVGRIFLQN